MISCNMDTFTVGAHISILVHTDTHRHTNTCHWPWANLTWNDHSQQKPSRIVWQRGSSWLGTTIRQRHRYMMSSARDIPTGNGDPKQQHSLVWPDLEGQWLTWWGKIGIIGFVTSQRICCSWPQGLKSCKKKLWWCRIRYLHKQRANPSYTDDAAVLVPSQLEQLFVTLSD